MRTQKETLLALLTAVSEKMVAAEPVLTELDSQIGDGDCGFGIKKGFATVMERLPAFADLSMGDILRNTGLTLVSAIGGTSGAILGSGFMKLGAAIGQKETVTMEEIAAALEAGYAAMVMRGEGTQVGDKTMIDALRPGLDAFAADGDRSVTERLNNAAAAARKGSDSTVDLIARRGRASYLGERGRGHRDAGSMAIVFIFEAARDFFNA